MEKVNPEKNIRRKIVAAVAGAVGLLALSGCTESKNTYYELKVDCPDATELQVEEVRKDRNKSFVDITCSGKEADEAPMGIEVRESDDSRNGVIVDNLPIRNTLRIEAMSKWAYGLENYNPSITFQIGEETDDAQATITLNGVTQIEEVVII